MNGLTAWQIEIGSRFLAASNLGCEGMTGKKKMESADDVNDLWSQMLMAFEYEGLTGAEEEKAHWKEELEKGDAYCVGVVRDELPFLLDAEGVVK